ncbi:hypothetical protein ACFWAY_26165 [Rhodococcus sp. NPDC059968]
MVSVDGEDALIVSVDEAALGRYPLHCNGSASWDWVAGAELQAFLRASRR